MSGYNLYNGAALVEVLLYCDFKKGDMTIPGSPENPCKITLPISQAEHFVRNQLGEFCDVLEDVEGGKGKTGAPGCAGTDGTDGNRGEDGKDGDDGKEGAPGIAGMDGERGRTGLHNYNAGPKGGRGSVGDPGEDGTDGKDGDDGKNGDDGQKGLIGATGAKGGPGDRGITGPDGMNGDVGMQGQAGIGNVLCPDFIECIEIDECTSRFITRDGDCNIIDDVTWSRPKGQWCVSTSTTVDFDADDYKTSDTNMGTGYSVPLSDGTTLTIQLSYGVASAQPCRSAACGHTGNLYEDTHPNVNAYGPLGQSECDWVPMCVVFDPVVCGEMTIDFFDVDELFLGCNESIRTDPADDTTPSGDLTSGTPANVYVPASGQGNSNSDGSVTWNNLGATGLIKFDVKLLEGLSMGFGFSGEKTIKTQRTGTYIGNQFFDAAGNPISEPANWVDCT